MNEEMSTKLSQELLLAEGEDARARVIVKWLPDFARCQVTTSARVKQLVAKVDELARKMDAYHAPAKADAAEAAEDPRTTRLKLILAFAQRNWPAVALLAILIKVFGLADLIASLFALAGGTP